VGGACTSVMSVIRDVFSQQAAAVYTQLADTIDCDDWTVRCDWLRVTSFRIQCYAITRAARLVQVLRDWLQVLLQL